MLSNIFTSNFTGGLAPASNKIFQGIYLCYWLARGKMSERNVILNFLFQFLDILFTHGPLREERGSTDGLFILLLLLLLLLLLPTSNFLFLIGTENANFQNGLTFQATPVTPISSFSFSFYFLEHFCPENCPLLSGELSTDFRQSSDSYFS